MPRRSTPFALTDACVIGQRRLLLLKSKQVSPLFFVPVFIVNTYQTPAEGEYLAKGDENRVVYLCQWWAEEARHQHRASKGAQCHSGDELEVFHGLGSYLPLIALIYTDVSRIRVDPWDPWEVSISHWLHWLALMYHGIRDDPCNPWELFKLTLPKSYTPDWRHSPTSWCIWFACWSQPCLVGCTLGWWYVLP